jgi:hypothetical protein
MFVKCVRPWRLANVSPGQVITGTPIHSESQVVALPEKGNFSSRSINVGEFFVVQTAAEPVKER